MKPLLAILLLGLALAAVLLRPESRAPTAAAALTAPDPASSPAVVAAPVARRPARLAEPTPFDRWLESPAGIGPLHLNLPAEVADTYVERYADCDRTTLEAHRTRLLAAAKAELLRLFAAEEHAGRAELRTLLGGSVAHAPPPAGFRRHVRIRERSPGRAPESVAIDVSPATHPKLHELEREAEWIAQCLKQPPGLTADLLRQFEFDE